MKWLLFLSCVIGLLIALVVWSTHKPLEKSQKNPTIKSAMNITSSAFTNNGQLPAKYSCDGESVNPPLTFSDIPKNTKSLALIVDDPDAPIGTFVHWVVFNISPTTTDVMENTKIQKATEGMSGTGKPGFVGACPPSGTHRYFFKLYALDTVLDLGSDSDKAAVEHAMQGHILAQAELIGLYSRK